eukprot:CAMPEP_0113324668 /NCGR_PEP_ID=MMETSP0010_2-20120614/17191_1 /TAXON_ID=216773 ORGANISM="Corethron hystrix, Strain 308" /NCGR_SAMPLE_ID=MMETSP0010_2 /ASSEMBLY_ACC=CAM_ASM_000155 /LENGTH=193 /DNA_ID=CAMNT_0000184109 /DNA_START=67 /DNA_END=644 /DNA_ORIENTATION=+ /assembly_acc=CAM_ASM_000155
MRGISAIFWMPCLILPAILPPLLFASERTTATAMAAAVGVTRVAIVGSGGLAGLSVAHSLVTHHLQTPCSPSLSIDLRDLSPGGTAGGASSVAAGLLHPLNPRGDGYIYMGAEGMNHALSLLERSEDHLHRIGAMKEGARLRNGLYRLAKDKKQAEAMREAIGTGRIVNAVFYDRDDKIWDKVFMGDDVHNYG